MPDANGAQGGAPAEGPAAHVLSNGAYTVALTPAGGGGSFFAGMALTRWSADPTVDGEGFFVFVRDLESGLRWAATRQPIAGSGQCDARFAPDHTVFLREANGLELRTEVRVSPDAAAEVRRLTLLNRSGRPRHLDLTTYAELVLHHPAADAAHPAFSRLFVQTAFDPALDALLAWRRPRDPGETPLWAAHRLIIEREDQPADGGTAVPGAAAAGGAAFSGDPAVGGAAVPGAATAAGGTAVPGNPAVPGPLQLETDRARFLGRGRTPADPQALDPGAVLSGTTGSVLDPIFALRREILLDSGASIHVTATLAAGHSRKEVEAALARCGKGTGTGTDAGAGPFTGASAVTDSGTGSGAGAGAGSGAGSSSGSDSAAASDRGSDPAAGLRFFNGYGGFTPDGREYVIRLAPGPHGPIRPPLPWINVIANEEAGFLISESGAGYTWAVNSRENRLTPWSNDPVSDPHGEAIYVRDEETGEFWSPMPGPAPSTDGYETAHGFGYTRFHHEHAAIAHETRCFVPLRDPVKLVHLRLTNGGDTPRQLSVVSYAQWVLGSTPRATRARVVTEYDEETGVLLAANPERAELAHRVAFAAATAPANAPAATERSIRSHAPVRVHGPLSFTADRTAFLGRHGSPAAPAALRAGGPLDGRCGAGLDPCAAFRVPVRLAPGETAEVVFVLGEAADRASALELARRYRDPSVASSSYVEVVANWRGMLAGVQVETPSPELDLMVNGWLAYQNLACRVWGRSAFYQSGGAFGYRDQLQDAAGLIYLLPELTRRQIVLHAAHQFVEGDVLHWWHPPLGRGVRTRFSDDLLWLPYVASFYVRVTGDASVLDDPVRFLTARALEPGEAEALVEPADAGDSASVWEHCCRAIDRSLTRGAHGLPLIGAGDWNDGMNRVGREGRGESVWLGFFLYSVLGDFIPLCEARGDGARAARYGEYRAHLAAALNDAGWDGAWYRRAFYDSGEPLGSARSDECRIDAIAQAWAVISGAAPPERAERALDAMEAHLVDEAAGLFRLLTPAFDATPHDPGYIKGYLPGIRENGGQYTHGALWGVRALAELGRSERAAPLLAMLSPVSHTRTPAEVAVYRTEPYVAAADVYGVAPHVGRGGWSWYTGSAGWMYRVALESVLGLDLREGRTLALRPCIPAAWPGFTVRWRMPDRRTTFEIVVERAPAGERTMARLDGAPLDVCDGAVLIPLAADGGAHRVRVRLGCDVGPRYAPRLPSTAPLEAMTPA